jgi:hypothetical protein
MPRMASVCLLCLALLAASFATAAPAEDSLHGRMDALLEAKADGPLAPQATDAEFLRRIYLDFAGRIPNVEEARPFLADADAAKREKLIDKLLAGDEYPRRMSQVFHVMLMERLGDHKEWQKYLQDSFAANKPWDVMAKEMLSPSAEDQATRGAALFFSKRLEHYGENPVDVPGMVRDVGRLFMGIDVQCCQCHDHLFVDDYKQEYYQGLFAFVGQVQLRQGESFPAISEKPLTKKVEFMSVFVKEPKKVGPYLPGLKEVEIPVFANGEEWEVKPDPKTKNPGKLKFSTLKILSEQLPSPDNQLFKKNIANRLWWLMMGRGLVHPLDMQHAGNTPSHPELLELVANELAAHKFDMKSLLREIALSKAYQRSSEAADDAAAEAPRESYRVALEKPLSSEQLLASMIVATGELDRAKPDELQERFAKAFANPPREPEVEFSPTVKAALFYLNDSVVLGWLKPAPGNLAERLAKTPEPDKLAEEMYLAILTRLPSEEEKKDVADYLAKHAANRETAIRNLLWSLLASNEFCMNH